MSLSTSLNAALTGLTASARSAEVVSSNVANAMTEGYGVRRLQVSAQQLGIQGAGVQVTGVSRHVDLVLLNDRRMAQADAGAASVFSGFSRGLEASIGMPEDPGSLGATITNFERALVEAAARPESSARLNSVVSSAHALTERIGAIATDIGQARQNADHEIGGTVARLNTALEQISELNSRIARSGNGGRDAVTLMDERQRLVDEVAQEIPLRQIDRGRGEVALLGMGGLILLDGAPAELGFVPRGVVTPHTTVENGGLSGLTVNGQAVDVHANQAPIRGGRLEALFQLRDQEAPAAQARIDAVARDMVERFQDSGVDPTLGAGQPGMFTDAGGAFDPLNEVGLSLRLGVNAAADPAQGGEIWRIRDGLGAAVPGPAGDASGLQRLVDAMSTARMANSGDFTAAARSASAFSADFLSSVSAERDTAERREVFTQAHFSALKEQELQGGVDTDAEMQRLLLIEQAYAANAKVIQVVGEMLDALERAL